MNRILARAATLAAAGLLATVAVAGSAQADPITVNVPGCWGAGTTVVCDLTITVNAPSVAPKTTYVPVCLGTCQTVPVTTVSANTKTTNVCYSYVDGWGQTFSDCALPLNIASPTLLELVRDLLDCSHWGCPYFE